MYNFSVPSNFKAYIDNVVRIGCTFAFDRNTFTFKGLATAKKALLISPSAANFAPDTPMAAMDFCVPYVQAIFRFIGIDQIECVQIPDQFMPDEVRQQAINQAQATLMELAKTW
jgi:FMN-dependent NADH-azoreductase